MVDGRRETGECGRCRDQPNAPLVTERSCQYRPRASLFTAVSETQAVGWSSAPGAIPGPRRSRRQEGQAGKGEGGWKAEAKSARIHAAGCALPSRMHCASYAMFQ